MTKAHHPVRAAGGVNPHVRAFENIAMGFKSHAKPATLDWLEAHGLIQKTGWDTYIVPIPAHERWCAWCSQQVIGRV